tara:strand:- start:247 stop:462 length:216 start_codon:yes stop_codon:yes gene_type:complete
MKFTKGTKVKVDANLVFKGLTGIVEWSTKDEDGNTEYLLKDIYCPQITDKKGNNYTISKTFFYESWLKQVN